MRVPAIPGFDPEAFQKYFKNTGWLMLGKILSMIVGFLIARHLGPVSFGDLGFAEALTAIIAAIGTLGLDSFIIREIIHDPGNRHEILGTSFWLRIGINIILVPLSILIYLFYHNLSTIPGTDLTLIVSLLSIASFFKSFNVIDSYFQSQVQSKYVVHIQNICLLISALVKTTLVLLKLPLIYFALALVLDGLMLASGLMLIYHRKQQNLLAWSFSRKRAKTLISQSWPLIVSAVMVSIYLKIDLVMLKQLGSKQVGIYYAAAKISESWYFIPVAIITSVFPAIIHARKNDIDRYHKRLQNLYDLLIGISLPVAILISFWAQDLITLIYGDQYHGAGTILSIHIWSGIFVFYGSASSQYLLAEGYTFITFLRTSMGAVINVALNIFLIPIYGVLGAAIATLIAYFIATFFILLFPHTRKHGIMMFRSLFLGNIIATLSAYLKKRNGSKNV
ncbi:MAG TPA: flippase [Sphingobacteriaceae bacterium]|nr:flippase [Sphingobacteriaceae bacterium]